jgi:anti-sigma factor RsiW
VSCRDQAAQGGQGERRALQITAYLDDELDLTSALDLESHLEVCAPCARSLAAQRALRQAIGAAQLRHRPTAEQVTAWRRQLGAPTADPGAAELEPSGPVEPRGPIAPRRGAEGTGGTGDSGGTGGTERLPSPLRGERVRQRSAPPWPPLQSWWSSPRLRTLAALLLVAVGSWSLGRRWPTPSGLGAAPGDAASGRLADQVLASHLRAQLAGRPEDVVSSDRHTVKPWLAGKLDYSPPVVDLAAQGFPLRGGRLDYVGGRPVAALVYQAANHLVSVFVWPAESAATASGRPADTAEPPAATSRRGYQELRWSQAGMSWWAISDVAADRLAELVRQLRAALPPDTTPSR